MNRPQTDHSEKSSDYVLLDYLKRQIQSVIIGKEEAIELALTALLAGGHVLVEDLPGTGKTTLAKTLARSLGCSFKRLQFTPDLMPSDVTGLNYYNPKSGDFEFKPGPILTNILLADEINRATPRTQSALLEAMEEKQVTIDGTTRVIPQPFLVLATQNPIESEGTFILPFAQQDRFMLKIRLGYPSRENERTILFTHGFRDVLSELEVAVTTQELLRIQGKVKGVHMAESLAGYILDIVETTRSHADIDLALSPRASLSMFRAAKALALLREREYVLPDDIKHLCPAVFAHRLKLKRARDYKGQQAEEILAEIVKRVPVPIREGAR